MGRTDCADRIPVLAPGARFAGLEKGEVGLVVREDAGHEFDVGRVFALGVGFGKLAVPSVAEFMITPGPLFFAGRDVVIGEVNDARGGAVIVATEEILLRTHDHVGRGHGDVGIPGKIIRGVGPGRRVELARLFGGRHAVAGAGGVIHAVVTSGRKREGVGRALGVVGDVGDVRWEERLVMLVDARGDIGPPEKSLHVGRAVTEAGNDLESRATRAQAHAVHAFQARHRVVFTKPDGYGAVGVIFNRHVGRHERRRAVMLRPVELDATARPRTSEGHECGLDDRLVIDDVVAVGLVDETVDASAERGQYHHQQEFVFQINGLPRVWHGFFRNAIGERERIDAPAGALVNAFFQKHRIAIRRGGKPGRQGDGCAANADGAWAGHGGTQSAGTTGRGKSARGSDCSLSSSMECPDRE